MTVSRPMSDNTVPISNTIDAAPGNRLAVWALLLTVFVLVVGINHYPYSAAADFSGIVVYALTYAALFLLSYRTRSDVYLGISGTAIIAALFSLGAYSAFVVSILGIIWATLLRRLFYRRLNTPKPVLLLEINRFCYAVMMAGVSILVAGWVASLVGLDLHQRSIIEANPPLLVVIFVAISISQTLALSAIIFVRPYRYSQREHREIVLRIVLINLLPLPLGALVAAVYDGLSFSAFMTTVIGMMVGSAFYRRSEITRQALEKRFAELGLIAQFSQSLAQNLPMDSLLDVFYEQLKSIMPVDLLVIGLYHKTSDSILPIYVRQGNQRLNWPSTSESDSLFHYLARTRKPLLINDQVQEKLSGLGIAELYPPIPAAYIGIPLVIGDHLVGMISIEHLSDPNAYNDSDLAVIERVAPQTAIALRNAELYTRLSGMTGELSELNDLSRVLNSVLDLDRALNLICQALMTLIRADRTAIMVISEDNRSASIRASSGLSIDYLAQYQNVPLGAEGPIYELVNITEPVVLHDLYTDPRAIGWRSLAESEGIRGAVVVPMRAANRPLGIITVYYDQPHTISAEDLALMTTMSNQVAAAIANARLFGEIEQRAEDMSQLVESSYALIESLDVPIIAQKLADRLRHLLALDLAALYMPNRDGNQLERLAVSTVGKLNAPAKLPNMPTLRSVNRLFKENDQSAESPSGFTLRDATLLREFGMQSALVLHLTAHAAPIGVAILGSVEARRFTRREWQMAEALLNQAATAIDNATLFHLVDSELEERIRQLLAIENVSRKLTTVASLSVEAVIDEVLKAALSVTYADMVSCGLANNNQVRFIAKTRTDVSIPTQINPLQGISGRVIRTKQPALVADVRTDPDYVEIMAGTRAELCVPILIQGEPMGVLNLESNRENAFNASHLSFVTTLADHMALAIEQTDLFTEIQGRNKQMRVILDSTYNGMLLVGADSTLIEANSAAERLLNRPLAAYVGRNVFRLVADLLHDPNIRGDDRTWARRDPQSSGIRSLIMTHTSSEGLQDEQRYHYQVLSDEGTTIDVEEFNIPILDDEGQITARLIVLRDVTHEKAVEHFRDQMIDMVVHDLRSPLANVVTSLTMVSDLLQSADKDSVEQVVDIATQNTYKVIKQVESILEVRKMESGQIPLKRIPTRLRQLVEDAIYTLDAMAISADIQIVNRVASDIPLVEVDLEQMGRVFVNLLDNALKYTPNGGQIRVETELIGTAQLLVRVVDTGPGIPATMRRQVFDLFVTMSGKAVRGRRGMGLGLTFCRLIVEAHGGQIWADSGPEGGTAMCFTLPLEPLVNDKAAPTETQQNAK